MLRKVRITERPNMKAGGARNFGPQTPPTDQVADPNTGSFRASADPEIKVNHTLQPTSKENATLEAELGETVLTNLQGEGIPEFYKIAGKRHYNGGTPLNLPANSFIYTRDSKLHIKDENILAVFNKPFKKAGYTPADISKSYDLNTYREILLNPASDTLQRETAELMIRNYNQKLGALALAQESLKGFDSGLPAIAMPYMESAGIDPSQILPTQQPSPEQLQQYKGGGQTRHRVRITELPKAQDGVSIPDDEYRTIYSEDPAANNNQYTTVSNGQPAANINQYTTVNGNGAQAAQAVQAAQVPAGDPHLSDNANKNMALIREKLKDPRIRAAFVAAYLKKLGAKKPGKNLTQQSIDAALALGEDEIIDNFLNKLTQNFAVTKKYKNLKGDDQKIWDSDRKYAKEAVESLGYDALDDVGITSFQTGYRVLDDLVKDPEFKDALKGIKPAQLGRTGEGTEEEGMISGIDSFDANTTSGQVFVSTESEETPEPAAKDDAVTKHLTDQARVTDPRFWKQDKVNLGNALLNRALLEKNLPWQGTPQNIQANPAFGDFRGSAARVGSVANAGAAQAAGMLDPQRFASVFSGIQKGAVDPILKTQEAEHRQNTNAANKFEMFNVQNKNKFNMVKAGLDTQLYDKYTIANNQLANSKTAFRDKIATYFNNAWTNRGITQTMNEMRDDFAVDPGNGFTYKKSGQRDLPQSQTNRAVSKRAIELKGQYGDMTWPQAQEMATADLGLPSNKVGRHGRSDDYNQYPSDPYNQYPNTQQG